MLNQLLLDFFIAPRKFIQSATPQQWTNFLQQAREHGLTARCYYVLQNLSLLQQVPLQVRQHGKSAAYYAEKQQHSLYFELQQLESLFANVDCPCLLLKGSAYRALALPVSFGRLFADIDILVPLDRIKLIRDKLFFFGFAEAAMSDYDRHYYQRWSHQNPPLRHYQRGTVIDLHHHIYPTASAKKIDISPLFQHAERLAGSAFSVPKAAHLFIHAAVHLFYQEETHKLIKDIIDLNDLLLETERQQQLDWLLQQADIMAVQSAVINACWVLAQVFNNSAARRQLSATALPPQRWVGRLVILMLQGSGFSAWGARQLWFIRGHGLKMRWQILLYHTLAKPTASSRGWLRRIYAAIKRG
ncbi:nucleotidyltransferase domain-containing protein [Rheinheimera maricola]|uniref:Nucleotidyltransferase family protein n=1 Tax=Rheinheimera maricola TaxID=2793282 RepID=A0ABS7XEF4_9GAMM|nr:nucleotidyltransferase family protein [Rheinheimera maricola]MBZ9612962.1 nucleotidyltransferase family protein [Rheinheimera maricola]